MVLNDIAGNFDVILYQTAQLPKLSNSCQYFLLNIIWPKIFAIKKISVWVTIFCMQSLTYIHGVQKVHIINFCQWEQVAKLTKISWQEFLALW